MRVRWQTLPEIFSRSAGTYLTMCFTFIELHSGSLVSAELNYILLAVVNGLTAQDIISILLLFFQDYGSQGTMQYKMVA